jgi:hypothetical protein
MAAAARLPLPPFTPRIPAWRRRLWRIERAAPQAVAPGKKAGVFAVLRTARIAKELGYAVEITFAWYDTPKAANPGKVGKFVIV